MTSKSSYRKHTFSAFCGLVQRNFLVFFKNIPTVIFTLMVPLSIFAIYILFLRPMETQQIKSAIASALPEIIKDPDLMKQFYALADNWMIAGVLAVSCITVSLNTNYILVKDKENGMFRDMVSSPIDPAVIVMAYFTFNFLVTFMINTLVFFVCMIYLGVAHVFMISSFDFFAVVGVILFSSISASLITHFVCSFINSDAVMAPIVAIVSAAIGFLIGAYLPPSMMPRGIRYLTGFFPGTYSAGLFRVYLMSTPTEKLLANPKLSSHIDVIRQVVGQFNMEIDESGHVSIYTEFFTSKVNETWMSLVTFFVILVFLFINIFVAKFRNAYAPLKDMAPKKEKQKK